MPPLFPFPRLRRACLPGITLVLLLTARAAAAPGVAIPHDPPADTLSAGPPLLGEARRAACAGWKTVTAPCRWDDADVMKAGGILAGTAAAFLLDGEMKRLAERNRTAGLDRVEEVVVRYGDTKAVIIMTGGVYLTGIVAGDRWLRETGLLMGTALIITSGGVQVLKAAIGRARPYTGHGTHFFTPFTTDNDHQAFPSGHSQAAFTISSVLAARINNPWVTAGLYGLATATALSRIYSGNHWFSDVLLGALAASAVGRTIVRTFEGEDATGLRLLPSPEGISLVYQF